MGFEVEYSGELRIEPPVPISGIDAEALRVITALDGNVYTLEYVQHESGERALTALICGDDDYGSAKPLRWETILYSFVAVAQLAGAAVAGQMTFLDEYEGVGVAEIDDSGNLVIRPTPSVEAPPSTS